MKPTPPTGPRGPVLMMLGALLLSACSGDGGPGGQPAAPIAVGLGAAAVRDYLVTITALGTVVSRPGGAARMSAPAEGFVTAIRIAPGDQVGAGAPLVELDRTVWAEQAREADAALAAADEALARATRLVERGVLPAKDREAALAEQARARAAAAGAHRTLDRAVLRSPISGVVTSVTAAVSQQVAPSDVLVEVVDLAELDALVELPPEAAALVSPGDSVTLFSALDAPESVLATGTVRGVSSQVASTSGTVVARVALRPPTRPVRVGLTLSARIVVARHESAVVIPRSAIVPVTNGSVVYVVGADSVAHATAVEVGASDSDSVEVLSGLSGREQIVTDGAYGIVDGARVEASAAP